MPFIKITRSFQTEVWRFLEPEEAMSFSRTFYPGQIYDTGEVSSVDERFTVIEFAGIGVAEVPVEAWEYFDGILLKCDWRQPASLN